MIRVASRTPNHDSCTSLCPHIVHFFFFSSRRRHTRSTRDWSSDVCSSDLFAQDRRDRQADRPTGWVDAAAATSVRSEERRVGKGVDLGGGRMIKKKRARRSSQNRRGGIAQVDAEQSGGTTCDVTRACGTRR